MERRKVTFKLYPNAREAERLASWIRLHCELYNAALEERIDAYRKAGKSISYYDQQNALPEIKAARPEFVELGSHALQQTLHKLDLAFRRSFAASKPGRRPGSRALRPASGFRASVIRIRRAGNWHRTARVARPFASVAPRMRCRSVPEASTGLATARSPTI